MLSKNSWMKAWLLLLFADRKIASKQTLKSLFHFICNHISSESQKMLWPVMVFVLAISLDGKIHMSPTVFSTLPCRSTLFYTGTFCLSRLLLSVRSPLSSLHKAFIQSKMNANHALSAIFAIHKQYFLTPCIASSSKLDFKVTWELAWALFCLRP